jgi:hypothetical protein
VKHAGGALSVTARVSCSPPSGAPTRPLGARFRLLPEWV